MDKNRKTLKTIAYTNILNSIIEGHYTAGQILNEHELIEELGYSKSPIREALILLCNEGVLKSIPRYGYEVVKLTSSDIMEILKYRCILECGLLSSCFDLIAENQIARLKELDDASRVLAEDTLTQWENNQSFHLTLAEFSGNEYACKQLKETMKILKIAYAQSFWNKWGTPGSEVVDFHIRVIEAIKKNDLEEALAALREDILDFRL